MIKKTQRTPSNRIFGSFFTLIFVVISIWAIYRDLHRFTIYFLISSSFFMAGVTIFFPNFLTIFNKNWMRFGLFLGKIFNPLILGFIFFTLITPISIITRLFGRDELRIRKVNVNSYWVDRVPYGPLGDSFKNQF